DELVEDVAREALEPAVDAGHARGGILGARAAPEDRRLRELADVAAEVIEKPEIDLDVARLVPDLARHVHGGLPRRVGEVEDRPARAFHRLQFADEDAVHAVAHLLARREPGERRETLLDLELADVARPHAHE